VKIISSNGKYFGRSENHLGQREILRSGLEIISGNGKYFDQDWKSSRATGIPRAGQEIISGNGKYFGQGCKSSRATGNTSIRTGNHLGQRKILRAGLEIILGNVKYFGQGWKSSQHRETLRVGQEIYSPGKEILSLVTDVFAPPSHAFLPGLGAGVTSASPALAPR
jgi:hypothetical protein